MTPRGEPVPRAREPARWLVGCMLLGLLAAGVVGAGVMFWERVDVEAILRPGVEGDTSHVTDPGLSPPGPAADATGLQVAFLVSEASREFFPDTGSYARQMSWWRSLADSLGGEITSVRGAGEVRDLGTESVLVVPAAPCLPFDVGRALFRRLESGGGTVVVGPVGARDSACEWRDWSLVRSLTGARDVQALGSRDAYFVTVPAGLPFAAGVAPGARVEFGRGLQVAVRTGGPGAYWSSWGLSPAPAEGPDGPATAAFARVSEGGGRLVWFGFLAAEAATDRDRSRIRRMHGAALLWAANRPMARLGAWPAARRSALVVTEDVEARPQNAEVLADMLRARGVPGTFFVVTEFVREHPELAGPISAAGEVGTHTVAQRDLAGAPSDDQRVRLRRARETASSWSGRDVVGLRPPRELFDRRTLEAWSRVGGRYVAAVNDARSAAPEIHEVDGSTDHMVLLPRVITDDYNLLVREGLDWREATARLEESLRKVDRLGGIALLNLRTQVMDIGRVEDLGATLDSVMASGAWWTATGREAADWWRVRQSAEVDVRAEADSLLEITVVPPPETGLANPTLELLPPGGAADWEPVRGGDALRFARSPFGLDVVVDSVAPGDTARIRFRRRSGDS